MKLTESPTQGCESNLALLNRDNATIPITTISGMVSAKGHTAIFDDATDFTES